MKVTTILALLLVSQLAEANVHVSAEKHVGGRYVTKILSLDKDESEGSSLVLANTNKGYHVEVEREFEGFAGPVLEKDLLQGKLHTGLGIEFTAGFAFKNSKDVKNKQEIDSFLKNNAIEYFKASKALKMEKGEKVQFDFFAGMLLEPHVSAVGILAVATGGWDVEVKKMEGDIVKVELALIDSEKASFKFDKLGAMLSSDVGREMERGYELTLNLKDAKAKEAYERLFKGNILFAQKESVTNKNIHFEKSTTEKSYLRGTGVWIRTPLIAWFLYNRTNHLVTGEKVELNLEHNKSEKIISSSYEEESSLDLVSIYHARTRAFEIKYNEETKKFFIADKYELESNVGGELKTAINAIAAKTQLTEFFMKDVAVTGNKYYHAKLEVEYKEAFLKHLMSGRVDLQTISKKASNLLNIQAEKELAKAYWAKLDPTSVMMAKQMQTQIIQIGINHIKNDPGQMRIQIEGRNYKGALDTYAKMMRAIYKSPYLYKYFVEYSKNCGTEVAMLIESEAFAKKESKTHSHIEESCEQ